MSLTAALAVAQDSAVLDDLYGRGAHAYFSHNSRKAVDLLSEAIANGTLDPRAYYFRGLALRTLGREEDAALDFKEAAKLEQAAVEWIDVVSKSLERVQGATRLEIENYRRQARLQTRNERLAREKKRYEDITTEDERVLRKPPGSAPAPRPAPGVVAPPPAGATDPFSDDAAETPPPPPADPATDPAAEKPAPPAKPDEDGAEPPPPKPAPAKPAAEDPFGTEEPAEPAPEKPAAKPAPAKPANDPFAEDAAPEEEPAKPEDKPAEAEPEAAAQVPPAAKPGKASHSLFGALSKAIIGDAGPAKKGAKIDLSNAKDPFADDEAPAP
jgi:tetratricopeptide (TPR) repeat protein